MNKSRSAKNSMLDNYRTIVDTPEMDKLREIYRESGSIFSIGCPKHLSTIEELEDTDLNQMTQKDIALLIRLLNEMEASKICEDCRVLRAAVVRKIELLFGNYDNY